MADLDSFAIDEFRNRWHKKTNNPAILEMTDQQLLEDSKLSIDGELTVAALILLGTRKALGVHLPQCEVIMEYRSMELLFDDLPNSNIKDNDQRVSLLPWVQAVNCQCKLAANSNA